MAVQNAQRVLNYQLGLLKNGPAPSYVPSGFIQTYANQYGRLACVDSGSGDCLNDDINILNYGADMSGSADSTAALNAAMAAAATGIKKNVVIPDGNMLVSSTVTIPAGVSLTFGVGTYTINGIRFTGSTTGISGTGAILGQGSTSTKLVQKSGANTDFISDTTLAVLTGTDSDYGVYRMQLRGLTIDGNSSNNASGRCIATYQRGANWEDLIIQNCKQTCIYTEWGVDPPGFSGPSDDITASMSHFRVEGCGGDGVEFRGPHDMKFIDGDIFGLGGWGFKSVGTAGVNNATFFLNQVNIYTPTTGAVYTNAGFSAVGTQFTTSTGHGLLVDSPSGGVTISGSVFAGPIGIELKSVASNQIQGLVANTTTAGVKINGGSCGNCQLSMFNNTGIQVHFASEVGPSVILATSADPLPGGATLRSGTPSPADFVIFTYSGVTQETWFPTRTFHSGGWTLTFPQFNSTLAVVDNNQQGGTIYGDSFAIKGTGAGLSATKTVKGSDGNNCNLVYTGGILTSTTCP